LSLLRVNVIINNRRSGGAALAAARATVSVAAIGFAGLLSPGKSQHFFRVERGHGGKL
jgi:hypothetical protein